MRYTRSHWSELPLLLFDCINGFTDGGNSVPPLPFSLLKMLLFAVRHDEPPSVR